jgi:hypothetical protein|tara:strand:+ start:284 stop:532 length:249 start_codon:yes stop_codon:yes gene_type:complete
MTDVHTELSKTNKEVDAHMKSMEPLPDFITDNVNLDWSAEFAGGLDWCEAAWREGLYRLGLMLVAVMIISAAAGFLWVLATH